MKFFIFFFLFSLNAFAVEVEVRWSETFRKELHLSCRNDESLCRNVCEDDFYCRVEEKACKNCIGTSIAFNHLMESIGTTLLFSDKKMDLNKATNLIKSSKFVTLNSRDVYNIIDPVSSLSVMKRFDKLCPFGSYESILFMEVEKRTRKLVKPSMVFCMGEENAFYELSNELHFELNE